MAKKPAKATPEEEEPVEEKPAEEKPVEKPKEKTAAKPAPKKVSKPKAAKKGSTMKSVEDSLAKMGYMDLYDIITLIVGIWGIVWSIIGFTQSLASNANMISNLTQAQALTDVSNTAWATLGMFIIQLYIYISLALFPFFVNGGMNIINKWPDSFPLHFIKNKEDFRSFIVFLGWFCALIFWVGSPSGTRWPHAISFIALIFVIFADAFRKKISKLPEKKIRE